MALDTKGHCDPTQPASLLMLFYKGDLRVEIYRHNRLLLFWGRGEPRHLVAQARNWFPATELSLILLLLLLLGRPFPARSPTDGHVGQFVKRLRKVLEVFGDPLQDRPGARSAARERRSDGTAAADGRVARGPCASHGCPVT